MAGRSCGLIHFRSMPFSAMMSMACGQQLAETCAVSTGQRVQGVVLGEHTLTFSLEFSASLPCSSIAAASSVFPPYPFDRRTRKFLYDRVRIFTRCRSAPMLRALESTTADARSTHGVMMFVFWKIAMQWGDVLFRERLILQKKTILPPQIWPNFSSHLHKFSRLLILRIDRLNVTPDATCGNKLTLLCYASAA